MVRKDNTIEIKYAISQLSSRVQRFAVYGADKWNFRCPICGDSNKSRTKARAWIYQNNKGNFSYKCFNCGESMSVQRLLKEYFSDLYEEYRMSVFKDRSHIVNTQRKIYSPETEFKFDLLVEAAKSGKATTFLKNRMIPESMWKHFFYCDKVGSLIKNNRTDGKYDERIKDNGEFLVSPIYNWIEGTDKKVVQSLCCRNLDVGSSYRYIHAKLRDDCVEDQVIWGLDLIDTSKPIICCEGIFDAVFLDNAIGMLTSVKTLRGYKDSSVIYLIDNEPRNKDIVKIVKGHIAAGRTVSLLPEKYLLLGKDVNEYIKNGVDKLDLMNDIMAHAYSGPRAALEFERWKKI